MSREEIEKKLNQEKDKKITIKRIETKFKKK